MGLALLSLLMWALPTGADERGHGLRSDLDRAPAEGTSTFLEIEDHGFVNPFTGGVAWETSQNADVLSMEWDYVGVSEVLPLCAGAFDWASVDGFLARVASRGHKAILRPVFFGPGYGQVASSARMAGAAPPRDSGRLGGSLPRTRRPEHEAGLTLLEVSRSRIQIRSIV